MTKKSRFYFFSLILATLSVLLSTVIHHHHHDNRICFVEEQCQKDGHVNDEHTEHHEKEQKNCSVHQMHQFLVNAKLLKSIHQHIFDGGHTLVAVLPFSYSFIPIMGLVIAEWQDKACVLPDHGRHEICRRGPPCFCLLGILSRQ